MRGVRCRKGVTRYVSFCVDFMLNNLKGQHSLQLKTTQNVLSLTRQRCVVLTRTIFRVPCLKMKWKSFGGFFALYRMLLLKVIIQIFFLRTDLTSQSNIPIPSLIFQVIVCFDLNQNDFPITTVLLRLFLFLQSSAEGEQTFRACGIGCILFS